jgi:prophage regulatory protein
MNMSHIILRLPTTLKRRGKSRSAHYLDIKNGLFVKPVQIGLRAVGTPEDEVDALNAVRIAGKSDEEIRALVVKLEAARKALA